MTSSWKLVAKYKGYKVAVDAFEQWVASSEHCDNWAYRATIYREARDSDTAYSFHSEYRRFTSRDDADADAIEQAKLIIDRFATTDSPGVKVHRLL